MTVRRAPAHLAAALLVTILLAAPAARAVTPSQKLAHLPAAFSLRAEDVVFPSTRDSVALEGWWIAGSRNAPVVVMAGGGTGNRSDLLPAARAFHDRGFTLLLFDYRDFGPRGAGAQDSLSGVLLATRWVDDTEGALLYAAARADSGVRVFGWGTDVGGITMLAAASRDRKHPPVTGLVVDNPYRTLEEQMSYDGSSVMPDVVRRQRRLASAIDEPFSSAVRLTVPVLVTLAEKDEAVPAKASDALFLSARVRVDRWRAPGVTRAGLLQAPGYLDRVTEWILYTAKWTRPR